MIKKAYEYAGFVGVMVSKKLSGPSAETEKEKEAPNIFAYMLNTRDPDTREVLTMPHLMAEGSSFVVAGSDTIGTIFSASLFYLTRNPSKLKKLQEEIRTTFPNLDSIKHGPVFNSCKYLHACIEETLRIASPVGGALWREVREENLAIDGVIIPRGCEAGVASYALHHNPRYFPNPFAFEPERWIVGSSSEVTKESVAQAKLAWIPFTLGPRSCVGKNLAQRELYLQLAIIVWQYDFRIASDPELARVGEGNKDLGFGRQRKGEYQVKQNFSAARDGPWLEFKAREI